MQDNDQIAELFKDTFNNYEAPVRPELWQQVASRIQVPAAPSVPDGASAVKVVAASTKISSVVIAWVVAAVVTVSVVGGYYIYNSSQKELSGTVVSQEQPVTTEISPSAQETPSGSTAGSGVSGASNHLNSERFDKKTASENDHFNSPHSNTNTFTGTTPTSAETAISNQPTADSQGEINATSSEKNNSPAATGTPLASTPKASLNQPIKIKIQALPASGYAPLEVNFTSTVAGEVSEWQFGDGSEGIKGVQARHTFDKPGTYLVTYKNTDENGKSFTELVKIEVLSNLTITNVPNIFTPNDDGVNDVFTVTTDKDIDIEVSIFDKNGKFVHKYSGTENGWNGKINNQENAGEGTYYYVIFATGKNGAQNTQKGTITLKR